MADDSDTDQGDDYGADDSDDSAYDYDGGDDGDDGGDSGDDGDSVSEFAGDSDGGAGGGGDYADGYGGYGSGDDSGADGGDDTGDDTDDASDSDDGGYSSDPEDGQPNQSQQPELMCEWQGKQYPVGTVLYMERGSAYEGFPARGYYRCTAYGSYASWTADHDVESKAYKGDPWPSDEKAGMSQAPDVDGPYSAEPRSGY